MAIIHSVRKALQTLDALAAAAVDRDGLSLGELAAALGERTSTLHNILKTMEQCGYASHMRGGRYGPGPRCADLAFGTTRGHRLRIHGAAVCGDLAEETGASTVFAVLMQDERRVLARAEGGGLVRINPHAVERQPVYEMVTTRVLLAHAAPDAADRFVEIHGLPGADWRGIDSRDALDAALADIRATGHAVDRPQGEVFAAAVPAVLDEPNGFVGAVGAYAPFRQMGPHSAATLLEALTRAAQQLVHRVQKESIDHDQHNGIMQG